MRFTALPILFVLAACGTSTETFTVNGEDVTREEFEELTGGGAVVPDSDDPTAYALGNLQDEIDASGLGTASNSSFAAVSTATGEASFLGVLDIASRGIPGREYNMLTETTITVDFDGDTLDTTFGEAVVLNTANEVVANPAVNLEVSNGTIGGARPNDVAFELAGDLTGLGFSAIIQADLEGSFRGTPIQGLIAVDDAPLLIVDGAGTPGGSVRLEAVAN